MLTRNYSLRKVDTNLNGLRPRLASQTNSMAASLPKLETQWQSGEAVSQ